MTRLFLLARAERDAAGGAVLEEPRKDLTGVYVVSVRPSDRI